MLNAGMAPGFAGDERVLDHCIFDDANTGEPVSYVIAECSTPEQPWYLIRVTRLDGASEKPKVLGSLRMARVRWMEATGGRELPVSAFKEVE